MVAQQHNVQRENKEKLDIRKKTINKEFLTQLINVVDIYESTLKEFDTKKCIETEKNSEIKEFYKGFFMTYKELLNCLKRNKLIVIDQVSSFDSKIHELFGKTDDNIDMIEVINSGYKYYEEIIRKAKVERI